MEDIKRYSAEELQDAECIAKVLSKTPEEQRGTLLLAANAFMAGLEAGIKTAATAKEAI